ncbi:MAG: hypothetical protein Q9191_002302 [Dirinaria sp. TL-2023a]
MPSTVVTATAWPARTESKPELPAALEDRNGFFWSYTEEPHRSRRQAIIKAHPEVTKLCGPEPLTKYIVIAVLALQLGCALLLRNTPILSPPFLLTAYIVGATANQNLFLSIHEISHNLAFRNPLANRLFAIFANLPIGLPYSAAFRVNEQTPFPSPHSHKPIHGPETRADFSCSKNKKPYHLTHHKSLGVDGLDTDLPTALEAFFLDSVLGKAFFCTFQILFYAIRPMMVYQLPLTWIHLVNIITQLLFDCILIRYVGARTLTYLILSSFLAGSLHPCAGHFIAEHYVFEKPSRGGGAATKEPANLVVPVPETFSYYGPLNVLTYNVGLHNEHHDFPAIPWSRLPALHELAKEFYADLPRHESWVWVIWQFIWDREVGMWCRVKRKAGGRKVAEWREVDFGAE